MDKPQKSVTHDQCKSRPTALDGMMICVVVALQAVSTITVVSCDYCYFLHKENIPVVRLSFIFYIVN